MDDCFDAKVIEDILERHQIAPFYRPAFHHFAEHGGIEVGEFDTRLECCINYKAARDEIRELLSQPIMFRSSLPPLFESLDPSDFPPFGDAL